ncbi:MAG: hypothetical protein K5761_00625 [Clostridiales bacterium]|nr:hypothetical protein [Clostridiales bacterium]
MKNRYFKTISVLLALSLFVATLAGCSKKPKTDNEILLEQAGYDVHDQVEYETIVDNAKKSETVYVNLHNDGKVRQVLVTDWLHVDEPFVRIKDTSNLTNITNVKTLTEPVVDGDYIYWDMDTTDLYYSGTINKLPPLEIRIQYYLNGTEVTAEEIAGQAGHVAIKISAENTLKRTITVDGKEYSIACPMIMAGGTILQDDDFSNVVITNGSTISDGSKQIAFFVGVPGIDESLGISALNLSIIDPALYSDEYIIEADTECFEIGNIMFASMPFSAIGSLGNGNLPDNMDGIKDVLTDLEGITDALGGLDVSQIIDLLYGDSNRIEEMMQAVSDAAQLYQDNEKLLKTLSKYMTDENLEKIDKLVNDLNASDLEAISNTLNDETIQQLLKILPQLSKSLSGVSTLANDINDVMPILQSLANDMDDPEIRRSLENLPQTITKLKELLDVVEKNKELLDAIGGLTSEDSTEKIEAILGTANKYSDLSSLSEGDISALAERVKAWLTFGSDYNIFTRRTANTTSTVMFTYKADGVKIPETPKKDDSNQDKGFFERILSWFTD